MSGALLFSLSRLLVKPLPGLLSQSVEDDGQGQCGQDSQDERSLFKDTVRQSDHPEIGVLPVIVAVMGGVFGGLSGDPEVEKLSLGDLGDVEGCGLGPGVDTAWKPLRSQ